MTTLTIGAQTLPTVSATRAKNEFDQVLERALTLGAIAITKHDSPKAVLMSVREYERLLGGG